MTYRRMNAGVIPAPVAAARGKARWRLDNGIERWVKEQRPGQALKSGGVDDPVRRRWPTPPVSRSMMSPILTINAPGNLIVIEQRRHVDNGELVVHMISLQRA